MIQISAQPVAGAVTATAAIPADKAGQGAETGRFAELLASQPDHAAPSSAAVRPAGTTAQPTTAPAGDLAVEPADTMAETIIRPSLAGALPVSGKMLPGVLPDAANAATAAANNGADSGADNAIAQNLPGAQAIPTLLAAMRAIQLPGQSDLTPATRKVAGASSGEDKTAGDPADSDADADAAQLATMNGHLATLVAASGLITATPTETAPATSGVTAGDARPAPAGPLAGSLPALIEAQLQGRPLPQPGAPAKASADQATDPATAEQPRTLTIDPGKLDRAAISQTPFTLDAGSAAPAAEVRLRPVVTDSTAAEPASSDATGTATTDLQAPTTMAAAMPTAALAEPKGAGVTVAQTTQPHDFAALMDRLIAARDAAQTGLPQSVHMAVQHAEFGQISVNFQHDKTGLAVSLANPDPDFARAVQAAIPPALASSAMDSGTRDNNQSGSGNNAANQSQAQSLLRGDASANGGEAGQRGRSGTRFAADDGRPASNGQTARGAQTGPEAAAGRARGIFA